MAALVAMLHEYSSFMRVSWAQGMGERRGGGGGWLAKGSYACGVEQVKEKKRRRRCTYGEGRREFSGALA